MRVVRLPFWILCEEIEILDKEGSCRGITVAFEVPEAYNLGWGSASAFQSDKASGPNHVEQGSRVGSKSKELITHGTDFSK